MCFRGPCLHDANQRSVAGNPFLHCPKGSLLFFQRILRVRNIFSIHSPVALHHEHLTLSRSIRPTASVK